MTHTTLNLAHCNWLVRACVGPVLWAVAFAVIYALHGVGCGQGWTAVHTPLGNLQQVVLVAAYGLALLVTGWALWRIPRGEGATAMVVGAGGWIGWGGTLLTLFPVLGMTTCG